jgi:membrane protein YqaA with SNARE-associated domain
MAKSKLSDLLTAKDMLSLIAAIALSCVAAFLFSRLTFLQDMGYVGVFLISIFSSATIFIPLPGFAVVFAMGAYLNPFLVGVAAGLGSGLGEISGYLAGYAGHDAAMRTSLFKQHKKGLEKYGPISIFALALLPNPIFDLAGMAAGAIRMPIWKFLAASIMGKMLRFILLAYIGLALFNGLT